MSRPIAEIIGWKATTFDEFEDSGKAWVSPDGSLSDGPSVDDMLAWIRSQDAVVLSAVEDETGTPALTEPEIDLFVYGRHVKPVYVDGKTLHEALEAAVRAVAGVGSEDTT